MGVALLQPHNELLADITTQIPGGTRGLENSQEFLTHFTNGHRVIGIDIHRT
jgi:hypothetical protein